MLAPNLFERGRTVLFGLVGAGGFGREVISWAAPLLREAAEATGASLRTVFVEEAPSTTKVMGFDVISLADFLGSDSQDRLFNVAVGDSQLRERLAETLSRENVSPISLIAKEAFVGVDCAIAEGAIICPFSTLTADLRIGRYFHSNIYSYVAHDCEVGDYVTLAPRASVNGRVSVERHAYVGAGAVVRQGSTERPVSIGERAVLGMGAVVTKSVPAGVTVTGNPARPMDRPY